MKISNIALGLLTLFSLSQISAFAIGSGSEETNKTQLLSKIQGEKKIGELTTYQYQHLYFAAQPSEADLAEAKKAGIEIVINLRAPSEYPYEEDKVAKKLGLKYYQVTFLKDGNIDPLSALELEKIHAAHPKTKQLIHCSSGNRAAAWFATHLALKYHLSADDSVEVASHLGLTKAEMQEKVKEHINKAN